MMKMDLCDRCIASHPLFYTDSGFQYTGRVPSTAKLK